MVDQLPEKLDDGVVRNRVEPVVSHGQCVGFSRIRSDVSQRFYDVLGCIQLLPTSDQVEAIKIADPSFTKFEQWTDSTSSYCSSVNLVAKSAQHGRRLRTLSGFSVNSVEVESCLFSRNDLLNFRKVPIKGGKKALKWIFQALTRKTAENALRLRRSK